LVDPNIDSRILKGILILRLKGTDCILLAQERDKWWAVVNMVINLQVPQNVENFLLAVNETGQRAQTGLIGLEIETSGRLL
jgi:hypothetical protein